MKIRGPFKNPRKISGVGFGRDRRGAVALEFALISVPLILFLIGIIEVGHLFFRQHQLSFATSTVARTVYIDPDDAVTAAQSALVDELPDYFDAGTSTVTVQQETVDGLPFVSLNVSHDYTPLLPGLSGFFAAVGASFLTTISADARVADPSVWNIKEAL